eukprot:2539703-Rhodomonas_salina.2
MVLCACYAQFGTDLAYAATRPRRTLRPPTSEHTRLPRRNQFEFLSFLVVSELDQRRMRLIRRTAKSIRILFLLGSVFAGCAAECDWFGTRRNQIEFLSCLRRNLEEATRAKEAAESEQKVRRTAIAYAATQCQVPTERPTVLTWHMLLCGVRY